MRNSNFLLYPAANYPSMSKLHTPKPTRGKSIDANDPSTPQQLPVDTSRTSPPRQRQGPFMRVGLQNLETSLLFKEYLRNCHANEYLTAFVWLHKIKHMSREAREPELRQFWENYLQADAVHQIHTELDIQYTYDASVLQQDDTLAGILSEVEDALVPHWHEFVQSSMFRRFIDTTAPKKSRHRRVKSEAPFLAVPRAGSDEFLLAYSKIKTS